VSPQAGVTNCWFPNGVTSSCVSTMNRASHLSSKCRFKVQIFLQLLTFNFEFESEVRLGTRGTETSKYPEEYKSIRDSVSSGERKRISLNPDFGREVAGAAM
jgi:hypothetical protein